MQFVPDFSNNRRILPQGEYKVVFDGKVLGKFNSLDEAQRFQSELGQRGSRIIPPNLRKQMTQDQINIAEAAVESLDKWDGTNKNR